MRIDRIKIASELARQDLNVNKLAEKAGLSRVTVSSIKCGKSCAMVTALKLAKALGVDITEIMKED